MHIWSIDPEVRYERGPPTGAERIQSRCLRASYKLNLRVRAGFEMCTFRRVGIVTANPRPARPKGPGRGLIEGRSDHRSGVRIATLDPATAVAFTCLVNPARI